MGAIITIIGIFAVIVIVGTVRRWVADVNGRRHYTAEQNQRISDIKRYH